MPSQSLFIAGASKTLVNGCSLYIWEAAPPPPAPNKAAACLPSPQVSTTPLWPPAVEKASYSEEEPMLIRNKSHKIKGG